MKMNSRGKNFTERERCKLLELIQKFKHIIENKCINAATTIKKNETWEAIALEFNNTAEVKRTPKQLYTAYLNLKRTSRQHMSIRALNGGIHKPVVSNIAAQKLDLEAEQVQPLTNNCDSASSYYNNNKRVTCQVMITKVEPTYDDFPSDIESPCNVLPPNLEPQISKTSNDTHQTSKTYNIKKKNVQEKNKINNKNNMLKTEYYQKKLESAVVEKKIKILEYNMMLKRQKLLEMEMKIKEKEYNNLMNK